MSSNIRAWFSLFSCKSEFVMLWNFNFNSLPVIYYLEPRAPRDQIPPQSSRQSRIFHIRTCSCDSPHFCDGRIQGWFRRYPHTRPRMVILLAVTNSSTTLDDWHRFWSLALNFLFGLRSRSHIKRSSEFRAIGHSHVARRGPPSSAPAPTERHPGSGSQLDFVFYEPCTFIVIVLIPLRHCSSVREMLHTCSAITSSPQDLECHILPSK